MKEGAQKLNIMAQPRRPISANKMVGNEILQWMDSDLEPVDWLQ